jgi:hypothetical protein
VEIHPPHGSIHSWKDFLIQLGTITAGVLIALSLEGVRESIRDRALVREARENIRRELADNKHGVDGEMAAMNERAKQFDTTLRLTNDLLKNKQSDVHQMQLGFSFPTLSVASWQTAERTGALAHMDYAEVQKYSGVYIAQDFCVQQQHRAFDALSAALGILTAVEDGDPTKASPADLERFRQQVVVLRSVLFVEEQLARSLSETYKKALE